MAKKPKEKKNKNEGKEVVPAEGGSGDELLEDVKPKKSKLKKIILLVPVLAILGGGGYFGYKFFFTPKPEAPPPESALVAETKVDLQPKDKDGNPAPPPMAPAPGLILTLDPFMVNLSDGGGRRFLRVIVSLDVGDAAMQQEIVSRMPRIRDSLLLLFGSKNSNELSTTAGKLKLRSEILKSVNNVLGIKDKITQAYFVELVVQ